jgi:arginine repressor
MRKMTLLLKKIQQRLEQQENIKVSLSTICRVLQNLNLSRKKTLHASERNTDRVQELRFEYRQKVKTILAEELVFVDEAGSHLGMTLPYASSERGTRTYSSVSCNRGQNR